MIYVLVSDGLRALVMCRSAIGASVAAAAVCALDGAEMRRPAAKYVQNMTSDETAKSAVDTAGNLSSPASRHHKRFGADSFSYTR